jgi:hypothetical protein
MDQLTSGESERLIISYPAVSEWARAYQLPIDAVTRSLDRLATRVLGSRPWLMDPTDRSCLAEIRRLGSVLQQLERLNDTDVFSLSLRCPTRMARYEQALHHLLYRAETLGVRDGDVQLVLRLEQVHAKILLEVRAFYQGLS